jgi:hypothetical protein
MRCPKGTRKNKMGDCMKKTEKKSQSPVVSQKTQKKTRCPKGTRKNKMGDCIKKIDKQKMVSKMQKMSSPLYTAQFFDVAAEIFTDYQKYQYIIPHLLPGYNKNKKNEIIMVMIQDYVTKNKSRFHPGDILFVGSTHEGRQYENGFVIIGNESQVLGANTEGAVDLPILYRKQIPENVYYTKMIEDVFHTFRDSSDDYDRELAVDFFGADETQINDVYKNVIETYKANGI